MGERNREVRQGRTDGGAQTRPTSRTTCCMPLQRVTQDRSGSAKMGEKATVEVTGAGRPDGFDGDGHDDTMHG